MASTGHPLAICEGHDSPSDFLKDSSGLKSHKSDNQERYGMDTDELTPMAYDCILLANEAADVLKTELGALCSRYRSEDDYLGGILEHVREIEDDPREYLDWWNRLEQTNLRTFKQKLKALREHIEKTIATPLEERGTPEW
jgi:hypothetical protein